MYATHFDRLVQAITTSGTRRGLLRLSGVLPLSGALSSFLAEGSEAAKHRHHTRQHRSTNGDQLQEQGKKKKKKCAHAGQRTSKKRKRCCAGLAKDGNGVCVGATTAFAQPAPATACTSATCGGTSICVRGTCQPCDVCESGCLFTSVAQAVAAANAGETIRICPGLYTENLTIDKSLTLIGAGDGNGAGNTILRGSGTRQAVIIQSVQAVALERLRITGGATTEFGAGIRNTADRLTLTGCTITGNKATSSADGGGIANFGTVELINSRVTGNTSERRGAGVFTWFSSTVTLDAASRVTGNQASLTNVASGGGIFNNGGTVTLSSGDNVTGNTPHNCGGTVPLCSG
jgi:hypothetical protein